MGSPSANFRGLSPSNKSVVQLATLAGRKAGLNFQDDNIKVLRDAKIKNLTKDDLIELTARNIKFGL